LRDSVAVRLPLLLRDGVHDANDFYDALADGFAERVQVRVSVTVVYRIALPDVEHERVINDDRDPVCLALSCNVWQLYHFALGLAVTLEVGELFAQPATVRVAGAVPVHELVAGRLRIAVSVGRRVGLSVRLEQRLGHALGVALGACNGQRVPECINDAFVDFLREPEPVPLDVSVLVSDGDILSIGVNLAIVV